MKVLQSNHKSKPTSILTLLERYLKEQRAWVAFLAAMLVNFPVLYRYAGPLGVIAYSVVAGILAVILTSKSISLKARNLIIFGLLVTSLILQIFLLFKIAPLFDTRMDRDDALVLWWQRLFQGQYPYQGPTRLGNPISILPFLHVVAFPFYLSGNIGFLPITCWLIILILLKKRYVNSKKSLFLGLLAAGTAPVIFLEVAGRSDLILNALLLVLLLSWAERIVQDDRRKAILAWWGFLGALAATRIAIWPVLVLSAVFMIRFTPGRRLISALILAATIFAFLVLPFILWDPQTFFGYAPIGVNVTKLGSNETVKIIWMIALGLVTLLAALPSWRTHRLVLPSMGVLVCIVFATWATFFYDVSYVELILIPVLFSFG